MGKFRSSSYTRRERHDGKHRFEHWYRDNSIYFITSKTRDAHRAFASEDAKSVFWDRLNFWSEGHGLELWCVSLLDNHYHILAYLKSGENLGPLMHRLHGSVAKLVNDLLPARHLPFWRTAGNKDYFDGCLRDENQLRRTFRYVQNQAVRARIVKRWEDYAHTRAYITFDQAIERARQLNPYLPEVPYARYTKRKPQ